MSTTKFISKNIPFQKLHLKDQNDKITVTAEFWKYFQYLLGLCKKEGNILKFALIVSCTIHQFNPGLAFVGVQGRHKVHF